MTSDKRTVYVTREAILNVLSDQETAKVSTAETAQSLRDGEDYIDLEHVDLGVQRVEKGRGVAGQTVLPRSAVSSSSWTKIMEMLKV